MSVLGGIGDARTRTVTATTTLSLRDRVVFANAASGAIVLTLPSAALYARAKRELIIKKIDSSANTVTLTATIDGAPTRVLSTQWQALALATDGINWLVV